MTKKDYLRQYPLEKLCWDGSLKKSLVFTATSGSTGEDATCNIGCIDSGARTFKIDGSSQPSSGWFTNIESVKAAIHKGPLMTTMTVYADFLAYSDGIYKTSGKDALGGHAIGLVGYDDTSRTWIIRNSWGPEWGNGGYARISWDDKSGIGNSTWLLSVPVQTEYLAVLSPQDREYAWDTYNIKVATALKESREVLIRLRNAEGLELQSVSCTPDDQTACTAKLDTTQLKEGRYELFAEAAKGSALRSQVRAFYVINSAPQLKLSYIPVGVDLSKTVKGRIEFEITTDSAPVPMSRVDFVARGADGRESIKSNEFVLGKMKMGWRSNSTTNGEYEIFFRGEMPWRGKTYRFATEPVKINVQN